MAKDPNSPIGFVRDSETYTLAEVARRLGWQRHAIRQAKRQGLQTIRFGSRDYVTGAAVRDFLESIEKTN